MDFEYLSSKTFSDSMMKMQLEVPYPTKIPICRFEITLNCLGQMDGILKRVLVIQLGPMKVLLVRNKSD